MQEKNTFCIMLLMYYICGMISKTINETLSKLSLKEGGLLMYLMYLSETNIKIVKSELYILLNEKKNSIDSAFKKLQEKGHVKSKKITDEKGRFVDWQHSVSLNNN